MRIHLDTVAGLGSFVELEGVAPPDSDLSAEREKVARLQQALGIEEVLTDSYSDRLLGADALVAAAREAMDRAHAPYSRFHVGAALRAEDGSIHAGANVENSAYPQGQCAEASAIGVLVAAGRTRVLEAAVIADSDELCVPCGGCRQRLREFMPLDGTIHLCSAGGERRTTTLEELLPLSFGPEFLPAHRPAVSRSAPRGSGSSSAPGLGAVADALEDAVAIPYTDLPDFPQPSVHGTPGRSRSARCPASRSPVLQGRATSTRAATPAPCAAPCAR